MHYTPLQAAGFLVPLIAIVAAGVIRLIRFREDKARRDTFRLLTFGIGIWLLSVMWVTRQ